MKLDSRIRFGIQDLMDEYEKVWRAEIQRARNESKKDAKPMEEIKGPRQRTKSKVQEEGNLGSMQVQTYQKYVPKQA
jgi:hypothetical protein